jgi:2-polyprenyl-3-methyl-5-hydroxy-6-metoxy-1,4-benzoquinol methylase
MPQLEKRPKPRRETTYGVANGPKYELIAKWIGKNKRVLDVGCGTGGFLERLTANGNHVIGVELSQENYGAVSRKERVYFGDFLKIQIKESFDIVLFGDVLEHMYHPDEAIEKAKRLAEEMIVCVPNSDFWGARLLRFFGVRKMRSGILDRTHVYIFNRRIIEKMIRDNGLEIVEFSSPAPKKLPGFYNHIIKVKPDIFGYQFIYRCRVVG